MVSSPEVLIVAEGDWYGVCRLPQIFHRAGVKSTLMVLPRGLARRTRYATSLPMEGYDVGHLVATLRQHLAEHPGKYQMIIPGDDMTVRALAAETDKEWMRPWFPVDPTPEKLNIISSKAAIVDACRRLGLPSPRSLICHSLEEGMKAASEIGYPVFFKGEESYGGYGVGRADNEVELLRLASSMGERHLKNFSIQETIVGRVGSTGILCWHGEAIQWSGSYKSATWPAPYGASTQRIFMRHPDIDQMAQAIVRETGFHGFMGIDWVQSEKTGRCHVIEMNPRPTPELHIRIPRDVDFSRGIQHLFCDGPKPGPLQAMAPSRSYRLFPQDLFRCYEERDFLGLAIWLWEIARGKSDIPWDDYSLAVGMVKKLGRHCRKNWRRRKAAR